MASVTKNLSSGSAGLEPTIGDQIKPIPFRTELSLAPLLAFWARAFGDDTSLEGTFARTIREETEKAPELLSPITDLAVIARHRKLVDVLMAAVFPAAVLDREYGAAIAPFQLTGFYATPPFQQLLLAEDGGFRGRMSIEASTLNAKRLLRAYALVLARVYSIELDLDYSFIFTVADPETGLDRHFKGQFDLRFVEVVPVGPTPPLTEEVRRRLHGNLLDADFLRQILPPENFIFRGFAIFKAVEVTDQEVLSSLKRDLIDKESIVSNTRFLALQQKLRTLFRRPGLRFGLAALNGDQVLILNYGAKSEYACIFADSRHHTKEEFKGSVYERAVRQGSPLVIDDLTAMPDKTAVDDEIVQSGARNLVVAPLLYQDRVIGTFELESPHPGDLDATHLPKLHEVLPLFSMAVQRTMEELNTRIQALIKEKCTAIHPDVEWRFRRAVLNHFERRAGNAPDAAAELEPIVFEHVHPLYALSDIRGSSIERSLAIQADVLAQLRLAKDVVQAGHATARARRATLPGEQAHREDREEPEFGRRGLGDHLPPRGCRAPLRSSPGIRPGGPGADRSLPRRPRPALRHGLRAAEAVRGERDADRRHDLVVPRPRGPDGAGDVPALLREAEDGRRGPPDLRRRLAPRGRPLRSPLPPEPPALAAHGHLRHRAPRPSAPGPASRAARDHSPRPRPARAALDQVPIRREAVRRGRRLRHSLRDRQEADRQGGHQRHERTPHPAGEDRDRLRAAR